MTHDIAGFIQDEWKATRRLSLTLGARYELQLLPSAFSTVANPLLPQTSNLPTDKNNIAPRVGFALDPYGNGKTAFRGGFGVFYGRTINSTIYSALTGTGNLTTANGIPVSQTTFSYTASTSGAPNFAQVIANAGAAGTAPSATYFDRGFQNPLSYQFDLAVQQDLGYHTNMALTYIGALGRQGANFVDANLPTTSQTITYRVVDSTGVGPLANGSNITTRFYNKTAGTCTTPNGSTYGSSITTGSGRPNQCFGTVTDIISNANSSYHALSAQLKHQLTNGLSLEANYTWSHSLDNGVNGTTFTSSNALTDPANPRADYGNGDNNVPNRLVVYAVYQTPKHFHGALGLLLNDYEIAPSFAGQSGLPFSATTSGTPTTAQTSAGNNQSAIGGGLNASNGAFRIPGVGRNSFTQQRTLVADLRASKRFTLRDGMGLELLIESFNIANHQNVTGVNGTAYTIAATGTAQPTITANTAFNTRTSVNSNLAYSPRQVQVGARFHF